MDRKTTELNLFKIEIIHIHFITCPHSINSIIFNDFIIFKYSSCIFLTTRQEERGEEGKHKIICTALKRAQLLASVNFLYCTK